jgi:signal transduction protein with GAF and PtsI domain
MKTILVAVDFKRGTDQVLCVAARLAVATGARLMVLHITDARHIGHDYEKMQDVIGSNDLTQLILRVDRDSEIIAPLFDERNAAVKTMISQVISVCRTRGRKIGICGQAPSDYPEFVNFLVKQGIDSISLNPDTVVKTTAAILTKEQVAAEKGADHELEATLHSLRD